MNLVLTRGEGKKIPRIYLKSFMDGPKEKAAKRKSETVNDGRHADSGRDTRLTYIRASLFYPYDSLRTG